MLFDAHDSTFTLCFNQTKELLDLSSHLPPFYIPHSAAWIDMEILNKTYVSTGSYCMHMHVLNLLLLCMSVCPHTWFVCRNLSSLARWQSVPALMLQRQIHPAFPLCVILHPIQISILFGGATSVAVLFEVAALGSQPVSCLILSQLRECNWLKWSLKINTLKRFGSIQRCLKAAHDQCASNHATHTGYILPT